MEALFRKAEFEVGVLHGIEQIGAVLQKHYPQNGASKNEISNKPLIL
jgi:uncharacterized membrane protein